MSIRDMVARHSNFDETKDFIPTPPFATRALYEYVLPELKEDAHRLSVWDPACGEGHMCRVFEEYGHPTVLGTDKYHPSYGATNTQTLDFTAASDVEGEVDVIVTNAPYKHLNKFIENSMRASNRYVCMLVRIQALTGQTRWRNFYASNPPTRIGVFSDRIPFKTGRVVRKCSKMFDHMWMVWDKWGDNNLACNMVWIPPSAQRLLEKGQDYD